MRQLDSLYPMVVMATYQLDETSRALITRRGIAIREVLPLRPKDTHVLDEHDIRFEETWTKLRYVKVSWIRMDSHPVNGRAYRIFSLAEYDVRTS
jgi:hypothetical protein